VLYRDKDQIIFGAWIVKVNHNLRLYINLNFAVNKTSENDVLWMWTYRYFLIGFRIESLGVFISYRFKTTYWWLCD